MGGRHAFEGEGEGLSFAPQLANHGVEQNRKSQAAVHGYTSKCRRNGGEKCNKGEERGGQGREGRGV